MNVVLIVTDDQEAGTVNPEVMPYLSSLPHEHWVVFPNSLPSTPVCGACRANLLGGERADTNGVTGNVTTGFDEPTAVNVAVQNTGAVTGCFGKWLNDYATAVVKAGWDDWWVLHTGEGDSHYYDGWTATNASGVEEDETDYPDEYIVDIIAGKAAAFIAANAADPFYCYVAFTAPHSPSTPAPRPAALDLSNDDPDDWNILPTGAPTWLSDVAAMTSGQETTTRGDRLDAKRALAAVDEAIETIITALDTAGVLDDTIVIFCNDNAVALGRKRLGRQVVTMQKRSPYRYSSDALLRVRHPAATQRTDQALVDLLDIPATIIDVFDATSLQTLAGSSMLPGLTAGFDDTWREVVVSMHLAADVAAMPKWKAVRTSRWRYATYYDEDENELYDLLVDPLETVNIAADHPDLVAAFEAIIVEVDADPLAAFTVEAPSLGDDTISYAVVNGELVEVTTYAAVNGELVETGTV